MPNDIPCALNLAVQPISFNLYNIIISTGTYPDRLKFSVVKPIHKKGDKMNYTNYRPISILPTFSKVFEKVIYTRLSEYLINNKLLVENQYGFQKGLATDNAIFTLINEILNSLNNKVKVGASFVIYRKPLTQLIINYYWIIQDYGIKGKAKTLLESYLRNRYQRVQITNQYSNTSTLSNWSQITQGVPQGSILGPILFLIYINDLPNAVEPTAIPIIFADDASILTKNPNNVQLQSGLNSVVGQLN